MGDVTDLTLRLALLFLPGIICALLVERLVPTHQWSTARLALYSLVLGLACYLTYALLEALWFWNWPPSLDPLKSIADSRSLDFTEISLATLVAPFAGLLVSLALNRHWLNRFARSLRVSNKFGDLDVWARTFNSSDVVWVVVRDLEHDLAYDGWVNAFSDTYDANELLLRDVKVYQGSSGQLLYELDSVYLTRGKDALTIEMRKNTVGEKADA